MIPTAFRWTRNGMMLTALTAMALISVRPIQAQEKKEPPPRLAIETYSAKVVEADKVADALRSILSDGKRETLRIEVDPKQSRVIVQGSPEQIRDMKKLLDAIGDMGLQNPNKLIDYYRSAQLPPSDSKLKARTVLNLAADELASLALAEGLYVTTARDPVAETLGATLATLSDALRAQLKVPAGQGILVTSVRSDGPSALAGLKQHDILLTLGEHPLAVPDDLTKYLKAAGEAPVSLKLLRAGKKMTLQVRPLYRVTLGQVEEKKEYYVGVQLEAMDDALRSQLNLPAGQGVIVGSVVGKSPAEAAGVKPQDIILEFGGKAIDAPDKLAAQVRTGQDKPTTLKVLREGKTLNIDITPATRSAETSDYAGFYQKALNLYSVRTRVAQAQDAAVRARAAEAVAEQAKAALSRQDWLDKEANTTRQIEDLRLQIQALRDTIDRLNATLKANPAPKK